jgi:Zn-dependent peptidase ImmA (M78 family)
MAHRFLYEQKIKWLPVDIIGIAVKNWSFKWVHDLALEIGKSEDYVCRHVCQSYDGVTRYSWSTGRYEIILNDIQNADGERNKRVYWSCAHEVGHVYLEHLKSEGVPYMTEGKINPERYAQLEFEADLFAGEVLASKWLMRDIGVTNENEIAMICNISDPAALARYKKATADYQFIPINAIVTRQNFGEYLKESTLCRKLDEFTEAPIGDVTGFTRLNAPRALLPTAKPKFLWRVGNCPYCDGMFDTEGNPNFCIYCGKPLKKGLTPAANSCGKVNTKEAAYCGKCGNRVYRIRQGFCCEECEI